MDNYFVKAQANPQASLSYFDTNKQLIKLVWRASPPLFVALFVLALVNGVIPLANIFIASALLEMLVQTLQTPQSIGLLSSSFVLLLIMMGIVSLLGRFFAYLSSAVQNLHQTRVSNYIQLLIAEKAASIDLAYFENPDFHNQMQNSSEEAATRPSIIVQQLMMTAGTMVMVISMAAVIALWQPWIIVVLFISALATLRLSTHFGKARVDLAFARAETHRRAQYLRTLVAGEAAAKEIRLFGLRDFLLSNLRVLLETMYLQDRQLARRYLLHSGVVETVLFVVEPLLVAFTAVQTLQQQISIGQFSLYTQSIMQIHGNLRNLMSMLAALYENNLFVANLFRFLAIQPEVESPRHTPKSHTVPITPTPRIEFRNASFCYPGTTRMALENLNFEIRPGEMIALVGENGAGKTTIVKLLAGLYDLTSGQILLDGVDIKTLDRHTLRAYLSMIFQDYTIYHLTAYRNIGIGQVSQMEEHDKLKEAARRSGFDRVAEKLPDGYNTVLGRFWDKGHELSGGQRQLVALARALMRKAPILVLDEPSASLDIYTEQQFFQRLLEDRDQGTLQTVIFISHRFTTVRRADRILVLNNGRLIEEGTHTELIALSGHYAEMFNLQAQMYNGQVRNVE